jgi:hypothetical protein
MQKLLAQMDAKQALSFAATGEMVTGSSISSTSQNGQTVTKVEHQFLKDNGIETMLGGWTVGTDLKGEVSVVAKDAATAKTISQSMNDNLQMAAKFLEAQKQLAGLADAVKSIKVAAKDKTITGEGRISGAAVAGMIQVFLQFSAGTAPAPEAPVPPAPARKETAK